MRFLSAFIPSKGNLVTESVGWLYYCMEVFWMCDSDTSVFVSCSDFVSLEESEAEFNGQLGLDMAELEFGICPIMTGKEMSALEESDSLCMVMYLSQLYELLKDTAPASGQDKA